MTDNSNKKKAGQLGVPIGTAGNQLRKMIIFHMAQESGKDICFQCGKTIEDINNFSIEHKIPWLDSGRARELFFSIDNIAFSHLDCNVGAARNVRRGMPIQHGTVGGYHRGCRCDLCRAAQSISKNEYRAKGGVH